MMKPFSATARVQYHETDDYTSRVYAYENDVPNSYSVPAYSGQGYRYYILCSVDVTRNLQLWIKFGGKLSNNGQGIQQDTVQQDFKFQMKWVF